MRRTAARRSALAQLEELPNDQVSPLFEAVVEATEEAVINSLFAAESMDGDRGGIEALPIDRVVTLYRSHHTSPDRP